MGDSILSLLEDWQKGETRLKDRLRALRNKEFLTDISIKTPDKCFRVS